MLCSRKARDRNGVEFASSEGGFFLEVKDTEGGAKRTEDASQRQACGTAVKLLLAVSAFYLGVLDSSPGYSVLPPS